MTENKSGTAITSAPVNAPTIIPLGNITQIDIGFLPEHERVALLKQHTEGLLDINRKAQELHVDVAVLRNTLDNLAGTTKEVSESGNAVTITHTQTTKVGRTEIMMGNTQQAQTGKFTRTQTGEKDWTPFYILGGIIAVVIIAALFAR